MTAAISYGLFGASGSLTSGRSERKEYVSAGKEREGEMHDVFNIAEKQK